MKTILVREKQWATISRVKNNCKADITFFVLVSKTTKIYFALKFLFIKKKF